jgi:putative acetyltransferase
MAIVIRACRDGDAPRLSRLYRRSVEGLGGRDYSPAQVRAWAALAPDPARMLSMARDGRVRLVAADGADLPIGYADLEPDGHIDHLYCAPEAKGTGAAAALYDALERIARERGTSRLYSEASEAARRFFLRRGFAVLRRRDLEIDGVAIHNYAVEKTLG